MRQPKHSLEHQNLHLPSSREAYRKIKCQSQQILTRLSLKKLLDRSRCCFQLEELKKHLDAQIDLSTRSFGIQQMLDRIYRQHRWCSNLLKELQEQLQNCSKHIRQEQLDHHLLKHKCFGKKNDVGCNPINLRNLFRHPYRSFCSCSNTSHCFAQ